MGAPKLLGGLQLHRRTRALSPRRRLSRRGAGLALAAALGLAAPATAHETTRVHALLIAATDYQHLPVEQDMPSAAADAFLLARVLMERGVAAADVRLLTEGAPSDAMWARSDTAAPTSSQLMQAEATREDARLLAADGVTPLGGPTRARILEELDRLVRVAGPGEQVFIALSGHGEQQATDDRASEPDGFDEVFMPVDYARRLPDGRFDVAVLDDEIGERVQALLAKGVQVVFVGDFCHSEGATRGAAARRAAGGRSDMRLMAGEVASTDAEGRGRFTGFYAAPSLSQALGLPVPYWSEDPATRRMHGALTFYLATALQDPSLTTMRDVAVRVERDINMHARTGNLQQRLPPPQFEGDFAAPLPGTGVGLASSLWQVAKPQSRLTMDLRVEVAELILPAGTLNGVESGAIYALSQTRGGREQVVIYGRAEDVTATRATLRPVAAGELTEEAWTDLRQDDGNPMDRAETFTARLFAPGAPQTVWVARPEAPARPTPAQAEALVDLDALQDVQTRGLGAGPGSSAALPSYVRLVEPGAAGAALSLAFDGDRLVIRDEAENGRALAGMDLARALERIRPEGSATRLTGLRTSLAEGLTVASRFQRIRSAAVRVSDMAGEDGVSPFDGLGLSLYRHRPADGGACAQPWGSDSPAAWAAEATPSGSVEIDPADLGSPGGAQACDVFVIEVRNEGSAEVARSVLGDRTPEDWVAPCDRATGAALGPDQTFACAQPVSVGLIAFSSDSAIMALRAVGGSAADNQSGATRLNRGGRVRYVYRLTNADPDFLLRTDFMVLAARSPYRQAALPVQFSQLCQRRLQDAFVGPMGPGERGEPDACLDPQSRFRSARAANEASAPATVDGLFALLSDGPSRGGGAQPVGGTAMRRLTLQVTPRPDSP